MFSGIKSVIYPSNDLAAGAVTNTEIKDVGGLLMGTFKDPSGNIFGIIEEYQAEA